MKPGRVSYLCLAAFLAALLFSGCGGGGGGSQDSGGSGLGGGFSNSTSNASLRVVFPSPQALSVGLVADQTLANLKNYESSGTFGFEPASSLSRIELQEESRRYYAISSTIRRQIALYQVVVSGPGMQTVSQEFPASQAFAVIEVPSGQNRSIVIKALNSAKEELLQASPIILNLDPATTRELVGQGSSTSGEGVVPVNFELVDSIAPVTIIFPSNALSVEGPHREAVQITLDNNEPNARLFYKISEHETPASTLTAVTSDFVETTTTATIALNEQGVYLFEFYSIDSEGNQESLQQRQITVNFNLNPPRTLLDYPGAPYKFFTAATLGLSIDMQPEQTGVITYQKDSEEQQNTRDLLHLEQTRVPIGDGRVLSDPVVLGFQSEVKDGSAELNQRTTQVVLTDVSVGGSVKVTFRGSAQSFLSTGRVAFCDTDASSYLKDTEQCSSGGRLILLRTGRSRVGMGAEFDCFTSQGSTVALTDSGSCKPCTQAGVDCPN